MSEFNTENVTRSKPFQVEFGLDIAIVTRPDGTQCAEVYEYDIEDAAPGQFQTELLKSSLLTSNTCV